MAVPLLPRLRGRWRRSRRRGRCALPPVEDRLALVHKCLGRLAVVLCLAAMDVVGGLQVQAVIDVARHRAIEIFLHIAVGYRRARSQATGDLGAFGFAAESQAHKPSW